MSTAMMDNMPTRSRAKGEDKITARLKEEIRFLREKVASQSIAIEHLKRQAMEDPMTGVANRRAFERALEQSMAYYNRYGRSGALLVIDVNDFKTINDTIGHLAGDAILKHIARMLESYTRESDMVARLGGDEFCVILREVDPKQAAEKARHLAEMIAATPCMFEGKDISVTVSIGHCNFAEANSCSRLIEMADAQMYADKTRQRGMHY